MSQKFLQLLLQNNLILKLYISNCLESGSDNKRYHFL